MSSPPHQSDPSADRESSSRIVRNSVFNVIGMALIIPLNFVALFTLARRLGTEALGVFFTLFAISAVVFLLAGSGTTTILTRRVAQARDELRRIIAEAAGVLTVVCLFSTLVFAAAGGGWFLIRGRGDWTLLAVAAVALWARQALEFAAAAMRGLERFEFENAARVLQAGVFCGLVAAFVHDGPGGAMTAYVVYTISNLVAVALLAGLLVLKWGCRRYTLRVAVVRNWAEESWPVGAGDVLRRAAWQTETLLLAALQSPAAVGLYSLAYRPLQPLQILPRSLVSVTFPLMSRNAGDRDLLRRMVDDATALLWLLSLPVAVSVVLCARPLILLTAGADYEPAILLLQLLIWLTGFTFINTQARFVLAAVGRERTFGKLSGSVLVLKIALGLLCIPRWGIYGACVGNLVGEAAFAGAALMVLRREGIADIPWRRLAASSGAAIAMFAGLLPLASALQQQTAAVALAWLIPSCAVASLLYVGLCVLSGALPRHQLQRLTMAVKGMAGSRRAKPNVDLRQEAV